jgi:hypothetical protein
VRAIFYGGEVKKMAGRRQKSKIICAKIVSSSKAQGVFMQAYPEKKLLLLFSQKNLYSVAQQNIFMLTFTAS